MQSGRSSGWPALVCTAGLLVLAGCAAGPASTPSSSGTSAVTGSVTSDTTSPAGSSSATATHSGRWSIVALGDSVPAGGGCGCTPYPQLSGSQLSTDSRQVSTTNDAVGGYTTSDVIAQLDGNPDVSAHVAAADVVEIEVGANDVGYDATCGPSVSCYQPTIPTVAQNLGRIVSRVHELTKGHRTVVVLLDYWSVWLGGQYAAAQGQAYVDGAASVTDEVNAVIKDTATRSGSAYVDLRAAFKGPDYSYDETHYLAPDGDHPNAAGHEQIAGAVVGVVTQTLHL